MPTWTHHHTMTTTASPEQIWSVLADHATWPEWDHDVERVRIDGPVRPGTTGRLKPAGGPAVRFTIAVADAPHRYTDVSRLPLARLTFDHRLQKQAGGGTRMTDEITITGPLSWLFARVIGRGLAVGLPATMQGLADRASVPTTV